MHKILVLCTLLFLCQGLELSGASLVKQIQANKRAERKELLQQYSGEKRESYSRYNKALAKIIKSCAKKDAKTFGEQLLRELKRNDPYFEDLAELREDLDEAKAEDDPKDLKGPLKDYQKAQERYAKVLIPFTAQLIEKQMYGLAYDNIQQIIYCDPDNKTVRKYMGHEYNRKTKSWMNEYAYEQYKKNDLIWNKELGWVLHKKIDDYKDGKHYDYTDDTWGHIDELNKKHSTLDNPWPIETQHYEVYAACDLQIGIRAANELEGLYQAWIRDFVPFFGNLAMERLFDRTASPRKLKVYIFNDKETFLEYARKKKVFDPILAESLGFYSAGLTSSQFYLSDGWIQTLWHEVTHQLFGENCNRGGTARTALAEGLAVYMEYGRIEDGQIVLNLADNKDITRLTPMIKAGKLPKFYDIWDLTREKFHGTHRGLNYSLAGLCTFFMMQYKDGLYKLDFIDYLTESHQFPKEGAPLHDYLGINAAQLEKEYKAWVTERFKDL